MNTSIQTAEPKAFIPPDTALCQRGCAYRVWTSLLAGLLSLLFIMPAVRADQSPPGCTGSGLGILLFTDSPDVHIGDTLNYSITVFNGTGTGPVVCDATAIQAFVTTPDGVSHPITLRRTTLSSGQSDFYPNVVSYVVRAQDVQADATVRTTASDTGTIHQNDTNSTGGGNQGVNTEVSLPCIQLTVQCVGGIGENGALLFTGTVTNCGNNTLVGVTVTNFVNGGMFQVAFITNLARGQVASFSGSWIPLNPCLPSVATLVAQGVDEFTRFPRTVTSTATTTCSEVLTPAIKVTKTCPDLPVSPGQLLTFSGSVSNAGNVTLTNIVVVNNQPSDNTTVFTLASLAPGAVAKFSGSYLAPTNCSVMDTLVARAASVCGVAVTDTASATCPILTTPQIALTVLCPAANPTPGGTLTYAGIVRNIGNITLSNVVVTSDRPSANTTVFIAATLAPGASANFTSSLTVPADACSVTTIFRGTGRDLCTAFASTDIVSVTCPVTTAPGIAVTLTCPAVPVVTGGLITYIGTVRNSGNVTLNSVTVVNSLAVPATVFTVPSLAPGASANFSASFTAPTDTCSVSSTVTASGRDACTSVSVSNSASATCDLIATPRIVVTQNCPVATVLLGGLLTYTGSVSNAGNITLTNVIVIHERTGSTPVFTVATLAPGASANFTGSYTVPAENGCAITSTLTASGSGKCNALRVSATATTTCSLAGNPQVKVTLACPVVPVALGGTLNFTGVVINSGNVTLTNVVVRRNTPASGTPVFEIASLAVGASASFSGSYTVPTTDACASITTVTVSANDQCAGVSVTSAHSISCPLVSTPRLTVTQVCPSSPTAPGGLLVYSGTVNNTGNVTLTNVIVVSSRGVPNASVFAVATLAPGATATFSGSFVAPLDACSVTTTLTVSGGDQCSGALATTSVTTTCPLITTPQLSVTKLCPTLPVEAGGLLVFTGTVTNTGNVTLNNVIVVSSQPAANTAVFGPVTLAPGAGTNFTGSYTAPLNACSVTDTLTATGRDQCTAILVTNAVTVTCPINTLPLVTITLVCPTIPVITGSPITYTGTVRNSGSVTLNNVTVVNLQARPTTVITVATMAPGATADFSTSFDSPANACSLATTVTVQGSDSCNGLFAINSATATCPVVTTPGIEVTQACPPSSASVGGLLAFRGTVRNTGNITLTNVKVFNSSRVAPTAGLVGYWALDLVAAGNAVNDSSSQGNRGKIVNATLDAGFLGGALSFNGVNTSVDIANSASLNFAGPITLAAWVMPRSTVGIQDIVAHGYTTNSPAGAVFLRINNGRYEVGSWNGTESPTASAAVPEGDVGTFVGLVGVYEGSTWTLYRNGVALDTVTHSVGAVTVSAPWAIGSRGGGGDRFFNGLIDEVRIYNRSLTGAEVASLGDPAGMVPVFTTPSLAPGEMASFTGSLNVPPDSGCSFTSVVLASGSDLCTGAGVSAAATNTCPLLTAPGIEVTQFCPAVPSLQGSLLTFTGIVRNAGNSTLSNVVVVSDRPSANTVVFTAASLAPGASANFTGSYQVPTNCCVVASSVKASGKDCNNLTVTDTDTAVCTVLTSPRIEVTKTCPTQAVETGSLFRYSGIVRNAGDIVLVDVVVYNNQPAIGGSLLLGPITLAPGESVPYTAAYIVGADFCGTDTVTARGLDVCTFQPVLDIQTTTCPVSTAPRIALTQNCPTQPTARGGIHTFTGTVSNSGNVTLTNVFVVNNQPAPNTAVIGPITLAPGASVNFSGSYTAPEACCEILSTLTARGQDLCAATTVTATATALCPLLSTPRITVTQVCPVSTGTAGAAFEFSGTVRNMGDVYLTNVFVRASQPASVLAWLPGTAGGSFARASESSPQSDRPCPDLNFGRSAISLAGNGTAVLGPIELAPGESKRFSGRYVATVGSNPLTDFVKATGVDTCQARTVAFMVNCLGPVDLSVQPMIRSVTLLNGASTVTWQATPGVTYWLQTKTSPTDAWTNVAGPVIANDVTASKQDVVGSNRQRFYRVMVVQE